MLENRADRHGARSGARRVLPTERVAITLDLIFFLFDPHLSHLERALRDNFLMLQCSHSVVAQALVERVHHCVDRLLRASVAIGSLVMWLRALLVNLALVSVGEGANRGEVLLRIICVDLLPIELRVL